MWKIWKNAGLYGGSDFRDNEWEKNSQELEVFYRRWWLDIWKKSLSYNELDELWEDLEKVDFEIEHFALGAMQVLYNLILMAFWKHDNDAVTYYREKFNQMWCELDFLRGEARNEYCRLDSMLDDNMKTMSEDEEYMNSGWILQDNQERISYLLDVKGKEEEE